MADEHAEASERDAGRNAQSSCAQAKVYTEARRHLLQPPMTASHCQFQLAAESHLLSHWFLPWRSPIG